MQITELANHRPGLAPGENARIDTTELHIASQPSPTGKLIVGGFENSIFAAAWLPV